MRKKSTTGKPKGLDDYGQPVDLKKNAAYSYMRAKSTASSVRSEFEMIHNPLAGRTVEGGTRSMLEGMKSFMRGGGLRRGSM